jgi:NACHT domain
LAFEEKIDEGEDLMKSNRALVLGIILSGLISALSGLAGNLASNAVPDPMKPLLHYIWPIFALLTVAGIGFALWQARQQETPVQGTVNPLHLSPALAAQNRQRMLAKVRSFWIKGVLENSLHGAALMVLGLQEQPDAVAHPWQLVLQEPDQSTRTLPTGTRITQVYDEAVGELLLLGEPGSGKTTLLLELARDLLDHAEKESSLPMPVVFNLSSWATRQAPLAEWLVDEMNTKHQVPRSLGQEWIAADQVLPLLDGLDEVKKEYPPACVGAINTFRLQHGLVPMVVCSRRAEYFDLTARVLLEAAVMVQRLSEKQIDEYLSCAGGQLDAVRVALREDQALQKLITTPLMLIALTLAYAGKPVEELMMMETAEMRRRHIFETYVHRMLQRRGSQVHYPHEQTMHWLTWLAWQLTQQNQTEFYLERLQPEWLPKSRQRRTYRLVSVLVGVLVYGGSAYIHHFILRWFLRDAGVMPWNYVRFLDYAADHLLLRKVGGGYIFIHRLLMEYFASLPLPQSLVNDEQA